MTTRRGTVRAKILAVLRQNRDAEKWTSILELKKLLPDCSDSAIKRTMSQLFSEDRVNVKNQRIKDREVRLFLLNAELRGDFDMTALEKVMQKAERRPSAAKIERSLKFAREVSFER